LKVGLIVNFYLKKVYTTLVILYSEPGNVGRGERLGIPVSSPLLFNNCIEELVTEAAEDLQEENGSRHWDLPMSRRWLQEACIFVLYSS